MLIEAKRFNVYFATALVMAAISFCGCRSNSDIEKHPLTVLSLHMESNPETPESSEPVPIFRENPVMVNVDKEPILTESDIAQAKIVNVLGGFAIQLTFNDQGKWMLEQYTASNQGRRIAILCHWDKKLKEIRWIAAPAVSRRISNGILTFTPDATREESEKIVLGLNNMAKRSSKKADEW